MILSLDEVRTLEEDYRVNREDILLIALNVYGVRSSLPHPRMRLRLRLIERPEDEFFFILPLGREKSPFELFPDEIRFCGQPFAAVTQLENDDAVLSYFRNGHRVLTLNSNARSQCTGCAFCPNTLESASDPRLSVMDDLNNYFAMVERK